MVRSKFPGKPTKHSSRTRVNVLFGPLNNNPIKEQFNGCLNSVGDAITNQDEAVVYSENGVDDQPTQSLPSGAESDLMRVRLTRASFLGDQLLAANIQCSGQVKRHAGPVFGNVRRIKVTGSINVDARSGGKFVLPSRSVHSSRVIKPNKRFITVDTTEMQSYKTRVIKKRQCILHSGLKKRSSSIPVNNDMTMNRQQTSVEVTVPKRAGNRGPVARAIARDEPGSRSGGMITRNRVVLRQPRLKIQASASTSRIGPFSSGNKPGTITCGVCFIPRFFNKRTFLQRDKFNIYSCEACSAFIVTIAQQTAPAEVVCRRGDGKCYDIKSESSTEGKGRSMRNRSGVPSPLKRLHRCSVVRRCRACWLKICLRSFQMPVALRASLMKRLPVDMQEHNIFGGTVSLPANFLNAWYAQSKHSANSTPNAASNQSASTSSSQLTVGNKSSLSDFSTWVALSSSTPTRPSPPKRTAKARKQQLQEQQPQRQRYHRVVRDKCGVPSKRVARAPSVRSSEPTAPAVACLPAPPLIPLMDAATKRQQINLRGPRVKHVCRSASIVLGHSIATFPPMRAPVVTPPPETEDKEEMDAVASDDSLLDVTSTDVGTLPLPIQADPTEIPSVRTNDEPLTIASVEPVPNNTNVASIACPRISTEQIDSPTEPETEQLLIDSVSTIYEPVEVVSAPALITKKEKKAHLTSQLDVQYFAPMRKLNTNVPTKPKNLLSIDFWETYDFEEVCRNGFSLTGTAPFPVQAICFLCGSAGAETLLHCCLCCEPYHPYCLEQTPPLFRQPTDRFSWLCPRCTTCTACGLADRQKINCQKCHNTYHPQCFNTKWRTDDRPTVCSNCLRCKSCGTDNITKFVGNLALCLLCFKLRNKGNFCPLCQRCYDDNDFDTKMMECGRCDKWVHSKCEGLTDEQYQILSILPESVEYLCCLCSADATPYWRKAIQSELKNSFNTILCMLNKNQIARPLLKLTPVKTTCSSISTPKLSPASCNVAKRILFTDDEKMCDPTIDEDFFGTAKIENKPISFSSEVSAPVFDIPSTPNIADIKRKINCNEYFSLRDFNNGMETALHANGTQSRQLLEIYHNVLKKVFPWFDPAIEESPAMDMSFADTSKVDINLLEPDKKVDYKSYAVLIESEKPVIETRVCSLCKGLGDGSPQEEARLLYCGHNEWIHGNCALWSSEVYEEIDGSLQNVHSAINRGKSIKCMLCKLKGASIGCCQKGCFESYHFVCAKKSNCQFMADKSIYCQHHDIADLNGSVTVDFDIRRSIYVELDSRKKKYIESYKVNYIVGSLSVLNLGLVSASVSDTVDAIIPTSFVCSRLFWSTKSPWQLVPYVIKTSVLKSASKTLPVDKNFTVDHSQPKHTVDRKLKELSAWLKDEKDVLTLAEFDDEEEPQNTADILSPELTDAILQELPHGLLDGLMNMDFKNSEININELNCKTVPTDLLDMDLKRPPITNNSCLQQPRACSLRLSCKVNSPAMKKRKAQPAPPRENSVFLHLLVDGPCDSSSGSECDSPEPAACFDDDEEEEDYERELSRVVGEQPVTCAKCHCTYRTHASYARHLDGCSDPIFTSESDSEEQNQHMIVCPTATVIADTDVATVMLNINKKQQAMAMPTILSPPYETYTFARQGDATTSMTEYINQQLGASFQPQLDSCLPQSHELTFSHQPTTTFVVSGNADESQFALPLSTFNLSLNQLPLTLQSVPPVYSNVNQITIEPANMNQLTIDAKLIQGHQGATWGMKSIKSPRAAQYISTRKTQTASPPTQTLLVQQPSNAQVYIQSLPTNGQLVATVPTFVDSNGSYVSTGGNHVQYVTTNAAPQQPPTATVLQLHQATADGGFINLVPNIQMQPQSTPLYSIQPPTARLEGGQFVVDNTGSMLWTSAPAASGPVAPTAASAQPAQQSTQPLFYGFETIVQNTVMQSQQFLPTTMSGMLSSNSSYSTTTQRLVNLEQNSFQVFQTSKLEPVLDMSRGGFVLTPSQPTILNATAATYAPQEALPQLSFITPQAQQTTFTDSPVIQQPTAAILRAIKAEPFESFEPAEPPLQRPAPPPPQPQQLLLTKMPRQQALQLQQQQQKAMVELTVQTSPDYCNQIQQQNADIKPIVARTAAIPITYSHKNTIKHRPISRVLPMPTNPVKRPDLGPQQYRSKAAKKNSATNTMALQTMKPIAIQVEQKAPDNVLEVIKQNEEIARVKQEIIRAKEEIIKAKQEIVKTKEIIIPMNISPNLIEAPLTAKQIAAGTLAMPSASSPQLLEAPILPRLEITKMVLGSPKRHDFLIDDVRKAAQNTFPPAKPVMKEPERTPAIVESLPVLNDNIATIEQTIPMNELITNDQTSLTMNQVMQPEMDMPPISLISLTSSNSHIPSMVVETTMEIAKEPVQIAQAQTASAPSQSIPTTKQQLPAHPLVLNGLSLSEAQKVIENSEPSILYTIETHDGFRHSSTSIYELWSKVFDAVQLARQTHNMPLLPITSLDMINNIQLLGLKTNGLRYLMEQMPGAIKCTKYKPMFNVQLINKDEKSVVGSPVHKNGAVRMMPYQDERKPYDMFGWLTSKHRRPDFVDDTPSRKIFATSSSVSARYRLLKETCKVAVGVYPSDIHGRGLFAKTVIESGDMVIEYAGEVIRSILTDKREKYYNSKGIGCYMFRIDEDLVVDSTMKGNSARFINHSCDPNCYSKVVEIQGHKHIIIFALRRILCGEELTYDYKFPIEDDKIPCTCSTKRCRKFLN